MQDSCYQFQECGVVVYYQYPIFRVVNLLLVTAVVLGFLHGAVVLPFIVCWASIQVSFQFVEYFLFWVWMLWESMGLWIKREIYIDVFGTIKSGIEKPTGIMS